MSQEPASAILTSAMGKSRLRFLAPVLVIIEAAAIVTITACGASTARALHISSACTNRRTIALTFDDGPNPPYSEQILAILRDHGVSATFFAEGEATDGDPAAVRAEVAAGMAVGVHSWSHSDTLPSQSTEEFVLDTTMAGHAVQRAAGYAPALYRAPYGHTSNSMLDGLRKLGYVSVGWDVDSRDWTDDSADEIVQNVLRSAHAGAIVLMHDGGLGGGNPDRSRTIDALPRIIDGLRSAGYEFATIPGATGLPLAQGSTPVKGMHCSAS